MPGGAVCPHEWEMHPYLASRVLLLRRLPLNKSMWTENAILLQLLCKRQAADHYLPDLPALQASTFYIAAYLIQHSR